MRIINNFKDKEQWIKVLYKLEEYEWIEFNWSRWYEWFSTDEKLVIEDSVLTHTLSKLNHSKYKVISAEDYLNPIKIWDRVEVTDGDSEFYQDIFRVISYNEWSNMIRIEHPKYWTEYMQMDYLSVFKVKDEIKEFPIWTKVKIKDRWEFYTSFTEAANYIWCNNYKEFKTPLIWGRWIVIWSKSSRDIVAIRIDEQDYLINKRWIEIFKDNYKFKVGDKVIDDTWEILIIEEQLGKWTDKHDNRSNQVWRYKCKDKQWHFTEDYLTLSQNKMKYNIWDYITVSFTNNITKWKGYKIMDIIDRHSASAWECYEIINDNGETRRVTENEAWESRGFIVGDRVKIIWWYGDYIWTEAVVTEVNDKILIELHDWTPSTYRREYLEVIWLEKEETHTEYIRVTTSAEKIKAIKHFTDRNYDMFSSMELYISDTDNRETYVYINHYWEIDWTYSMWNDIWHSIDITKDILNTITPWFITWSDDSLSMSQAQDMVNKAINDGLDFIKTNPLQDYQKRILNTNTNNTMSTIQDTAMNIATEEYFTNVKNIKKIKEADTEMKDMLDTLENAMKEIDSKRETLNGIYSRLNNGSVYKNMNETKEILKNHEAVLEFLDTFITSTVSDFTEETTKEVYDVEKVFNK